MERLQDRAGPPFVFTGVATTRGPVSGTPRTPQLGPSFYLRHDQRFHCSGVSPLSYSPHLPITHATSSVTWCRGEGGIESVLVLNVFTGKKCHDGVNTSCPQFQTLFSRFQQHETWAHHPRVIIADGQVQAPRTRRSCRREASPTLTPFCLVTGLNTTGYFLLLFQEMFVTISSVIFLVMVCFSYTGNSPSASYNKQTLTKLMVLF